MRLWPLGARTETRSAEVSYTQAVIAEQQARVAGTAADAKALAVVEAATSVWERAFAGANVTPMSLALEPLDSMLLALIGRNLALNGNFIAAIRVGEGGIELAPVSSWDITGDSSRWEYHLDVPGPTRLQSLRLPAASVIHVRVNAAAGSPWRGAFPAVEGATDRRAGRFDRKGAGSRRAAPGRPRAALGDAGVDFGGRQRGCRLRSCR